MDQEAFRGLQAAREGIGLSIEDLWVRYFGLGGNAEVFDVDAYLAGAAGLDWREHNVLTLALNERFLEMGGNHPLPYLGDR